MRPTSTAGVKGRCRHVALGWMHSTQPAQSARGTSAGSSVHRTVVTHCWSSSPSNTVQSRSHQQKPMCCGAPGAVEAHQVLWNRHTRGGWGACKTHAGKQDAPQYSMHTSSITTKACRMQCPTQPPCYAHGRTHTSTCT